MEDHPPIYPRGRGRWRRAASILSS